MTDGSVIVAEADRLLRFANGHGSVIQTLSSPFASALRTTPCGGIYFLDEGKTRIQRVLGSSMQVVAGGNGVGPELSKFYAIDFFVMDDGRIYILDTAEEQWRVLLWPAGASSGSLVATLDQKRFEIPVAIAVSKFGDIYIADLDGHCVKKLVRGVRRGTEDVIVAGSCIKRLVKPEEEARRSMKNTHRLYGPNGLDLDGTG